MDFPMKKGAFPVRSVKSPEGLTFSDELSPVPGVPQDEHTGFDFRRNCRGGSGDTGAATEMVFPTK